MLELFLKDHLTLKTGLMAVKIQFCHHINKLRFKYIKIARLFFDQINAALVNIQYLYINIYHYI